MDVVMAEDRRSKPNRYGEVKKKFQLLLTPKASAIIDDRADLLGVTRAEFVERTIRWINENWDQDIEKDLSTVEEAKSNDD